MSYTPLWCKSHYSFLEGASHPEELVKQAHQLDLPAIAITDRDGVYGIVRAHVKARELGVKLIIGSQITLADGSHITLLVKNHLGYKNLCRLISCGRLRNPKGISSVTVHETCEHAEGLISLANAGVKDDVLASFREAFPKRLYALVARHRLAEEPASEKPVAYPCKATFDSHRCWK